MSTTNIIIPSSPEDRKSIKNALDEISNSLTRIGAEKDLIKDILAIAKVEEDQEIPKKYMRKMAKGKIYHQQEFALFQQETDDLETLYETVVS